MILIFNPRSHPSNWKGGTYITGDGYRRLHRPEHHFADNKGYVLEHRLVWEEINNACLLPFAIVHHVNGDTLDNRIENLEAMMNSCHMQNHNKGNKNAKKEMNNRNCQICHSKKTYINTRGTPIWLKYKDGFICDTCYRRMRRCFR